MVYFLVAAAALWAMGRAMKAPVQARWTMIGLLYAAVLAALVVSPQGGPLERMLGGSLGEWLVLGGLAAVIWAYHAGLARLRGRAAEAEAAAAPAARSGAMSEVELDRYARHIFLREIGGPGQRKLRAAKVLVVGAGGLGSPALLYLAAAGVGTIGVIDDDAVEGTNLQRQVIHTDGRIGMPKVFSAETAMSAINPFVTVRPYHRRLTAEIAEDLIADYDLVLDGTDSFETRYLVNAVCVRLGKPLIGGALSQWEGQVSLWDPARGAPCYRCIFPEAPAPGLAPTCAEAGVAGPLPGVVGSMMALEAVKEIAGAGEGLRGRMMIYDGLYGETRMMRLHRRADCPDCGGIH
ncbi:HesA/MoeB/ThiF family protein [Anianabacter salinae]|uniref:HesA/MoeB/ThiF family protein n=1 Tax=Anianabacter salinae TaxID=2851023 RepID=UPI00225E05A3|nr:HesA/MoeB/ThiF family protein [Anianabacter salinae]MBV0913948.1 HesA/MoeB/ThiF family protein [Anianabacter salinae]